MSNDRAPVGTENDSSVDDEPGFAGLPLGREVREALARLEHTSPTPIQAAAIPRMVAGADLIGQAATGTGKTGAFALPILERLDRDTAVSSPRAMVLVPTRELAMQVSGAIREYGREAGVRVAAVFGGAPVHHQVKDLRRGVHVVVATPGRAVDLLSRGALRLDEIDVVVLDEADEMLDMGFLEDLESLLDATPTGRQTVLFSATMPPRIDALARRYLRDPERIDLVSGDTEDTRGNIRQVVYYVHRADKPAALGRLVETEAPTSAIVFCRTRTEVDELTVAMAARGLRAEALHGGMDQAQRDRVMGRLRTGVAQLLVATDVAARGIDVDTLTHVINYDVPTSPESYVHRIGRVGRAGRDGVALTLAEPRHRRLIGNIERLTGDDLPVGTIPTVAELRRRQLQQTVADIRAALDGDDAEFDAVLDELSGHTPESVARTAIRLLHEGRVGTVDETEIRDANTRPPKNRPSRNRNGQGRGRDSDRPKRRPHKSAGHDTGFVHLNVGRNGGVRPGDLVGAITNESGLRGRDVGPIRIAAHYSVVGVPEDAVDDVVRAMRSSTVRGKRARVRRFVE